MVMVADVARTLEMSSSGLGGWLKSKTDRSSVVEAGGRLRYSWLILSSRNLLRFWTIVANGLPDTSSSSSPNGAANNLSAIRHVHHGNDGLALRDIVERLEHVG